MKQSLSWTLLAYAPIVAWADIPNAGSISREVEIPLIPIEKSQIATPTVQSAPAANVGWVLCTHQSRFSGSLKQPNLSFPKNKKVKKQ